MQRGKFIAFEHLDGGEAYETFMTRIEQELFPDGGIVLDKEPTIGVFGGTLGQLLSSEIHWASPPSWQEMTFGFLADRSDHCTKTTGRDHFIAIVM